MLYQFCRNCQRAQFYPRWHCVRCHGDQLEWRTSGGKGKIHSFTVVYRAPTAAFKAMAPYIIGLVDLDEGYRMMMNIDAPLDAPEIGSRAHVEFRRRPTGETLPVARLEA